MGVTGINHVVLKVRDLEQSDAFYRGVLGLEKVGERGRMWFYTAGAHHHDLALLELGSRGTPPPRGSLGLFHFCFDVPDEQTLAALYQKCTQAGVSVLGTADHKVMHSFYLHDPDGNVVEIGVDVPREQWANLPDPWAEDAPYALSTRS